MNDFQRFQSTKILSCYIEKGKSGEGSRGGIIIGHTKRGRPIYETKSQSPTITSTQRVEVSNFSLKEENYQHKVANQISKLSLDFEHNKRTILKYQKELENQKGARTAEGSQMKNNDGEIKKIKKYISDLIWSNSRIEEEMKLITNNFEHE